VVEDIVERDATGGNVYHYILLAWRGDGHLDDL
jgi:hypothetical protein